MSAARKLIDKLKEEVKGSQCKAEPTYLKLIEVFPLQTISSKRQYEVALRIVENLITFINVEQPADKGAEVYLKTLAELAGDYEHAQYRTGTVTGAEMLGYLMELQGLNQADLSKELGGQSIVSKILSGERELNLRQVKALAKRFKVSPEVFI